MEKVDHYDKFFWQPGDVEIYTPEDAIPLSQVPYMHEEGDEDDSDYDWEDDDEEGNPVRSRFDPE